MRDLNQRLLDAHAAENKRLLVELYQSAAVGAPDDDTKYFFLTHAYIYALDTNHPDAGDLRLALVAAGRES